MWNKTIENDEINRDNALKQHPTHPLTLPAHRIAITW